MEKPFLDWLLGANLLSLALMGIDKHRAKAGQWRVAEKWFFLLALAGGSPGAILGMYTFRHKTRHWQFRWGLPAILLLQVGLMWLWWRCQVELL